MIKQFLVILSVCAACCGSVAQVGSYTPEQFVGKWMWSGYKIDGVTDVDVMAEIDSTTYWLHANGTVTFSMRRIPSDSDSVYVNGMWKYKSKSNQLVLDWEKGLAADAKWTVVQLDASTLIIKQSTFDGRKRVVMEQHFTKVQ